MKFLFASPHCLLDSSSGAAISMQTLLRELARSGHRCLALGATIFDTQSAADKGPRPPVGHNAAQLFSVRPAEFEHLLVPTHNWRRPLMNALEEEVLERHFRELLQQAPPDVMITYGGMVLERSMLAEAKSRGVRTVFNLVNATYREVHTFKDVDHLITDTQATADLYRERSGLKLHPLGGLIDADAFLAAQHRPRYATFVNPSFEKGVGMVARLALMCRERLPEAEFLVVQSRGNWGASIAKLGLAAADFPNVKVLPTQADMRPVYAQSRVLLVPSFCHESGGRVAVEAMINGIPVIAASHGGLRESLNGGGVLLDVPADARVKHDQLIGEAAAQPWYDALAALWSDADAYCAASQRAREAGQTHDLKAAVGRFLALLEQPAGAAASGAHLEKTR